MYPDDLALQVWKSERTRYRPSNGSEGDMFQARWCARCTKDDYEAGVFCPIIAATMCLDTDDPNYPEEWTYRGGQPCCTAFERDWSQS
jgi:hypothetical protein